MRSKHLFSIALILIIGAQCQWSEAATKPADTLYYEVKMQSRFGDMGTRKMYMRGSDFEFHADSAGLKLRFIKNKDGAFLVHPRKSFVGRYPPKSTRNSPMVFLPGPIGDVKTFLAKNQAKEVGTELIGERKCRMFTYVEKETGWKCKLWAEQKTLIPVKLVMTGTKKDDTMEVTYIAYQRGVKVSDFHFELPKGATIKPMPEPKPQQQADTKKPEADLGAPEKPEKP